MGLEQQLSESWRPEHLVGDGAGLRLALEITQARERVGAQQGRAVRPPGGGAVTRHAIVAVGLISIVAGAPGVRPSRNSSSDWAPATADLVKSGRLGRSSEWV